MNYDEYFGKLAKEKSTDGIDVRIIPGITLHAQHYNDHSEPFVKVSITDKTNSNKRGIKVSNMTLHNMKSVIDESVKELKRLRK